MEARRCREDRWDFTEADGAAFPLYIQRHDKGTGELYGFCPSKVARDDPATVALFRILMIAADTGVMLKAGGIEDQPDWFVELLGWLMPRLDIAKFASKAQMVLGSSSSPADKTKALFAQAQRSARGGNIRSATR